MHYASVSRSAISPCESNPPGRSTDEMGGLPRGGGSAPVATSTVMQQRLRSLSFVFPMYNEAGNIQRCVSESIAAGRTMADDFEVVIVDDASTDGSGDLADELAARHPQLRVIHHTRNRRLGGALRTGFAAASKEWILYTDSDLPVRLADAKHALSLVDSVDMVVGYRLRRSDGLRRQVMSATYNRIVRALFDLKVRDVNFAFKLFRRSMLERVTLRSEGSFIDAEMMLEARKAGARVAEMGMMYQPRVAGRSTLSSTGVIANLLREMMAYRRDSRSAALVDG